jgi:L-ascorbate metabolism protein UlaG (beta-lactamase superfamily)
MSEVVVQFTYLNGPTALLEIEGVRFLTDPTFDPPATIYPLNGYSLQKTAATPLSPEALPPIDVVLLSHDHHRDNLDTAGREVALHAPTLLTTKVGAERLGGPATGLDPWQSVEIPAPSGRALRVTATPARHGPAGGDRGPVIGFVIAPADAPNAALYISGDTVWYEGVAEISRRFPVQLAFLFMGAAKVSVAGPAPLTFTAEEAVEAARAFPRARIVPLHFEGWAHFTESRADIERAFRVANLSERLAWPEPTRRTEFTLRE